ncbi:MAG TPA: 7TM-DISM domain-containing protein, partial [Pseudomonadales bacterium]|nr:7TM-DISM domain-containing protein [Pseudomonadales bacterium]
MRALLFIVMASFCCLGRSEILLSADQARVSLAGEIQVWEDVSAAVGVDQVMLDSASRFKPWAKSVDYARGFSSAAIWFKFYLKNPLADPLAVLLDIPFPVLDDVKLFAVSGEGAQLLYAGGDHAPYAQRRLDISDSFVIPLKLQAGQRMEYLLRVQSSSSLAVPLYVSSYSALLEQRFVKQWIQGIFYGVLVGVFLYNSLLWLSTRDHGLLFHTAHGLAIMLC